MGTNKPAPNSKLSEEFIIKYVGLLKKGNFKATAAQACRVNPRTVANWLERGEKAHKGIYRDFYEQVMEALALSEVDMVNVVYELGMLGYLDAAKFWLTKSRPKTWGQVQKTVALANHEGKPFKTQPQQMPLNLGTLNDEQLEAYERFIETLNDKQPESGTGASAAGKGAPQAD